MLKISVLDQSTQSSGSDGAQAIRDTIELAHLCESLGYFRFWVSEHHNHPTIAGSAPEILMAAIAQKTQSIRIGSAGIMLPHYSPLKIAEQFRVLEAIAPGRIDLGLGRAPGSDGQTAHALNPSSLINAEKFPSDVRDLMAWATNDKLLEGHPFEGIRAYPNGPTSPDFWMLGSSNYGAQVAAHFGIPYCFAHFITDGIGAADTIKMYKDNYSPSKRYPVPITSICIWALAARTKAEATKLFSSRAWWKIKREQGILGPISSPNSIKKNNYSDFEKAKLQQLIQTSIFGTSNEVADKIKTLASEYEVDEVVILTWTHEFQHRRQSYRLIAEAFNLT